MTPPLSTPLRPEARFRCGFSTLGCPQYDLAAVSALAARFNVRELELRVLAGRLDLPSYFAETDPDLQQTRSTLSRAGQHIQVLGTSVRLLTEPSAATTEERMTELHAFGALAEKLNTPWLRVFDGGARDHPPNGKNDWLPAIELLEAWAAHRSRRGWCCDLLVETHTSLVTAPAVLELVNRVNGRVHLLWDSHHTWREGAEPLDVTWEQLRPWVRHVHVKDDISDPSGTGHRHTLPGRGVFPFAQLFNALRRDGYDGVVSLEWEKHWHPHLPPLEDALRCWFDEVLPACAPPDPAP